METLKITTSLKEVNTAGHRFTFSLWTCYWNFVDGQEKYRTMWWFINLMVHGNLVLAVPAVLVYYFNASPVVLAITVSGFFGNLIANMGGAGIRVTLTAFFLSLTVNLIMLLAYII